MKRMYNYRTLTFSIGDGFLVDIVSDDEKFSAWLYHERCDAKEMMFGAAKDPGTEPITITQFIKLADDKEEIQENIRCYKARHMTQ